MITEQAVINFVEENKNLFEEIHPSFFEITTALAFKYFMEEKVDIAVIEVGLGGRLDCTNIINPEISIITNISFDKSKIFIIHEWKKCIFISCISEFIQTDNSILWIFFHYIINKIAANKSGSSGYNHRHHCITLTLSTSFLYNPAHE